MQDMTLTHLTNPLALAVLAIVLVTGIVRGFSGFGSGMIIGPATAALFSPKFALAMIAILDLVPTLVLVWPNRNKVNWFELLPVVIGYAILVPAGVWLLTTSDPDGLRWFISISIFVAVALLWSGWKYGGPRGRPVSLAVGGLGGFMGAAAALPGPAVLIYWLAGTMKADAVRANMIWYLFITDFMIITGYLFADVFTRDAVALGLLGIPGYFAGILVGIYFFKGASETLYRNIAFVIILTSAITSLPLLDQVIGR